MCEDRNRLGLTKRCLSDDVKEREDRAGSYRGRTVGNRVKEELENVGEQKELGELQIVWLTK